MKTNVGTIMDWITLSLIGISVVSCTGVLVVDIKRSNDEMKANQTIREESGGVLPGKEALVLGTGQTVDVMTILHEGKKYTCFASGRRMGCVKEFPYD